MNDEFVVFHSGVDKVPELDFRLSCGMLPAHSIPVAMCYGLSVVIIGSPHFYVNEVLEYVASVRGIPATEEQVADAKSGRVHVFELSAVVA